MMYDTTHANGIVHSSPIRPKVIRKVPPNPPSPRYAAEDPHSEIPWGDRKPAAKKFVGDNHKSAANTNQYDYATYNAGDRFVGVPMIDVEIEPQNPQTFGKDGVLFPRNSPRKPKPAGFPGTDEEANPRSDPKRSEKQPDSNAKNPGPMKKPRGETDKGGNSSDRMSKRELFWAAVVFVTVVILTLMITFIVISRQTRSGKMEHNISMKRGDKNNHADNMTLVPTIAGQNLSPPAMGGNNGSIEASQSRKISVREEWELVYSALRDNNVTRGLLKGRDATNEALPYDLYFYKNLVEGMVFSEEERDWIAAPRNYEDTLNMDIGIGEMSMPGTNGGFGGSNNKKRFSVSNKLSPNQKATAWLLFHDDLKDPDESVWRWAMASIYFKMGGENWNFNNDGTSTNNWLTNAPLCEWERLRGDSGCDKNKQPKGVPLLPIELDFDDTNMVGTIAIEFSLLLLPVGSPVQATSNAATTTNTIVRSITLTDNRLNGTIPGAVFNHLMPSLGKLYLDNNQLTGTIPLKLGGLDTLYVQNNAFTGDWPQKFCGPGTETVDDFGLDCDRVECTCCDIHQCYYSRL